MSVRSYFCSAAIKVMALLTLPATGTSFCAAGSGGFVPRCWVETDGGGTAAANGMPLVVKAAHGSAEKNRS